MLRYIVFLILYSFTEWLWAGACNTTVCCPVQSIKKPVCPLQKKLYLDLGISKTVNPHLSSAQTPLIKNEEMDLNFGVYPTHRGTGIFPNTMQIGLGYAWFRNPVNGVLFPYLSVGGEYRRMNPMHAPLTLTAQAFGSMDRNKSQISFAYQAIPLQNSYLFATAKMNPFRIGCVFPYISAGFGVSWMQAHDQQLAVVVEEKGEKTVHIQLPSIRQTNLGFRLGSGLDFALTQNLLMSVGYSYHNLGKVHVHKPRRCMDVDTLKIRQMLAAFQTLHLSSLTTHNIEFSLRYLFD